MRANDGGATRARLALDRWCFQHGPIDLIIDVDADAATCEQVIEACWENFRCVLSDLVAELPALRQPARHHAGVRGRVARRMLRACEPFARERFLTPMAAVAGSVADELLLALRHPGVERAFINNGGDIALHLTRGASYRVGILADCERIMRQSSHARSWDGVCAIGAASPVRGVATSGWRGRSQSLGIADSVTVLAASAAAADAAATLVANAVNCECRDIVRLPAVAVKDDSDLGERLVTVAVPPLPADAIAEALARGCGEAERWRDRGLLHAAVLFLQGHAEVVLPLVEAHA